MEKLELEDEPRKWWNQWKSGKKWNIHQDLYNMWEISIWLVMDKVTNHVNILRCDRICFTCSLKMLTSHSIHHPLHIPIVTYEGIPQNITLRFALYRIAENNSCNHRALSTSPVENFFGELSAMEFIGLGCPKSTDIMHLMGHVIQLIQHHLDPNR